MRTGNYVLLQCSQSNCRCRVLVETNFRVKVDDPPEAVPNRDCPRCEHSLTESHDILNGDRILARSEGPRSGV